jgi:hypothetical protein
MATRTIAPNANSEGSLGATIRRWATAFIDTLTLTNPLSVANGGTGTSSFTPYTVICQGATGTAANTNVVSVGAAAQVLTSNGAGALPTFQAVPTRSYGMDIVTNTCAYIP